MLYHKTVFAVGVDCGLSGDPCRYFCNSSAWKRTGRSADL